MVVLYPRRCEGNRGLQASVQPVLTVALHGAAFG